MANENDIYKHRIQALILTLPIAGVIGLIGVLLRGLYALPFPDADSWAQAASQPVFVISHVIILVGYILPFVGFWAIYKYLAGNGYEKIPFWGFILSIIGTSLALPALGITGFVGPIAAQSFLDGNPDAALIVSEALTGTGFFVSIIAAICYTLGPSLLGIAIWKSNEMSKWIGLLFALHGICLSLGFSIYPILIVGWVLFIASSIGMSYIIWRK